MFFNAASMACCWSGVHFPPEKLILNWYWKSGVSLGAGVNTPTPVVELAWAAAFLAKTAMKANAFIEGSVMSMVQSWPVI